MIFPFLISHSQTPVTMINGSMHTHKAKMSPNSRMNNMNTVPMSAIPKSFKVKNVTPKNILISKIT